MTRWEEIRHYVRFDADDEAALRECAEVVRPHFPRLVTEFYDRILEHDGARRVFSGPDQVERLKGSLARWLESCFTGPWDDAYFHIHSRIGRVHVWIGLEPRYMVLAMHLIRWSLQAAIHEMFRDRPDALLAHMRAIAKICDVELAIMLETYGDEYGMQIKRRERLAAIGQLGASISHEVKNPLGVIASSVYALKEHCHSRADEKAGRHLERIQRNVEQANQIVTTLLDFLRSKGPARVEGDWNALVAEAAEGVALPAGVTIELALAPGAGRARVDSVQIGRVVANLVRNAAEAMPDGGAIAIETRGDPDAVEVFVRDRGAGLAGDVMPQLYEPLYTTKPVGTGLGLPLAKAIVEAHLGTIAAANADGGGAVFRVRLPRDGPAAAGGEEGAP